MHLIALVAQNTGANGCGNCLLSLGGIEGCVKGSVAIFIDKGQGEGIVGASENDFAYGITELQRSIAGAAGHPPRLLHMASGGDVSHGLQVIDNALHVHFPAGKELQLSPNALFVAPDTGVGIL